MITVTYSSIDGYRQRRQFKTLKGASAYATKWVGKDADFGSSYAVSFDGVGKVTVDGCSLKELFAGKTESTGAYEVWVVHVYEEGPYASHRYRDSAHATLQEACKRAADLDEEGCDGVELRGTTEEAADAIAAHMQKQAEAYAAQLARDEEDWF